jgi:hypothetical protein
MARSVSVKIPTSVVIEMIETKLADLDKAEKDYPKLLSAYNKEIISYTTEVLELISKNKKSVVDYNDYSFDGNNIAINSEWRGSLTISIGKELVSKIGEKPKKPEDVDTWHTKQKREQLEKTLKLLKLTAQETITSSTYNSVLDLL